MAVIGTVPVGLPSAIATPPAGQIQEFFDNTAGPNFLVHSYKDEFAQSHQWPTNGVSPVGPSAGDTMLIDFFAKLGCSVEKGTILASDLVTLMNQGITVTDTETTNNAGNATSILTVGASKVPVTGVTVLPVTINPLAVAAQAAIIPTVSPSNATNKTLVWSSSNVTKVTVNQSGVVTGIATGVATITVTTADGLFTASCVVTVP